MMALCVNGLEVTPQAIEYELKRLVQFYSEHMSESEVQAQMDMLRRKAKEQAIGARLLVDEARRLDIRVPAGDVDARVLAMIKRAGGQESFDRLLKRQRLTLPALRQSMEEGRRVDLLIEKITAGVEDPTEAEIQAHYEGHRSEYMKPEQAQARHILIRPHSASESDRATARSRLLDIREKIANGADFADMAAAHSECPSGRRSGGSLGWISRGTMVPAIDRTLFSMTDGALSDVVETPLGFHILSRTASEATAPADFNEVKEKVRDFLRHVRRGEAIAAYVQQLKEKAVIVEDES